MRAIVCDKCGKVVLLEDDRPYLYSPAGVYRLLHERSGIEIELCEDCGNELIAEVRRMKEGDGNG